MDCRSLEEFLMGPEGRPEKGIRERIEEIQAEAKTRGLDRIEVEIRSTPSGTSASRTDVQTYFQAKDPTDRLIEALRKALESSPGEHFAGELRLNFRAKGESREHLGSYTRQMRPQLPTQVSADAGGKGVVEGTAIWTNLAKPLLEMQIRVLEASARVLEAAGGVVAASKGASSTFDPKAGLLGNLVKGVTGAIAADNNTPTDNSAPIGPKPTDADAPPGPGSTSAPKAITEVDESAVRQWLKKNPQRGIAIGNEMLDQFNMHAVPK